MTLQQFRYETRLLPEDTEIMILSPWGEVDPAAWVLKDDLEADDPVRDNFPENSILLTAEAA